MQATTSPVESSVTPTYGYAPQASTLPPASTGYVQGNYQQQGYISNPITSEHDSKDPYKQPNPYNQQPPAVGYTPQYAYPMPAYQVPIPQYNQTVVDISEKQKEYYKLKKLAKLEKKKLKHEMKKAKKMKHSDAPMQYPPEYGVSRDAGAPVMYADEGEYIKSKESRALEKIAKRHASIEAKAQKKVKKLQKQQDKERAKHAEKTGENYQQQYQQYPQYQQYQPQVYYQPQYPTTGVNYVQPPVGYTQPAPGYAPAPAGYASVPAPSTSGPVATEKMVESSSIITSATTTTVVVEGSAPAPSTNESNASINECEKMKE